MPATVSASPSSSRKASRTAIPSIRPATSPSRSSAPCPPAVAPCSSSKPRSPESCATATSAIPDVSAEIDRYRPIFVMGEVGAPGQYSYVPGMTVQKAIASAGGFSPRAQQANADITRAINGKVITGRVVTSDPLLPGDTIYVRERLF